MMRQRGRLRWLVVAVTALLAALLCACADQQPSTNAGTQELTDAPKGYAVRLPADMSVDFSLAQSYTKYSHSQMDIFISRETSPYDDILYYLDHYFDRYITTPGYQDVNNISLNCHTVFDVNGWKAKLLSVTRRPCEGSEVEKNTYSYLYLYKEDGRKDFFRIMVRAQRYDRAMLDALAQSFREIPQEGEVTNTIDTAAPILPEWNAETRAFYESLCGREDVMWGIFVPDAVTPEGMDSSMAALEERLDYKFELCMQYSHFPHDPPPLKGLREAYADGKITELTLQTATYWNNNLDSSANPNFEIIDGVRDEEIRAYARALKEFGHPVLLRVNNEMNTDWTSYAAVLTLGDPEIFKMVYHRLYDIFAEEGVDNVIWVFNPQSGDFPPANFNHYMSYFPGADRVQMIGITAYNSGEYYSDVNSYIAWKSFAELYAPIQATFSREFGGWPWIIGEFASDSHGGSKPNWITNMFNQIGDYKNIKAAIWLNWEAYDARKGSFGNVSSCYRLEETNETLRAFREGVHGTQTRDLLPER